MNVWGGYAPVGGHWSVRVMIEGDDDLVMTAAQLNERARTVAGDEESDALLKSYIRAARQQVERDTGIAIPRQTVIVAFDEMVAAGSVITIPVGPISTIAGIMWMDAAGTVHDIDPDSGVMRFDNVGLPPRMLWFGSPDIDMGNLSPMTALSFLLIVGYDDAESIPEWARFAVGLLAAHYLTAGRDRTVIGTSVMPMPAGYDEAIAAHRLMVVV